MILRLFIICFVLFACKPSTVEENKNEERVVENHIEHYKNGLKKMEGQLVNGKRHGKWVVYHENGMKWSEGSYRHGERVGSAVIYYENGKKKLQGQYRGGYKVGIWRAWERDGTFADSLDTGTLLSHADSVKLELIK